MIAPPERSPARDAAIDAMVPRVPTQGWTFVALRGALGDIAAEPLDAALLFPGGAPDMVEAFIDLADRRMEEAAAAAGVDELRLSQRVRAVLALRFRQNAPAREAVRRSMAVLASPRNAGLAARTAARTVDAIWHAAGDRSADFSWYTKRAILAGVYGSTLLFWLRDTSDDDAATLAFLDRRLAGVARIGGLRKRLNAAVCRPRRGTSDTGAAA